MSDQPVPVIDAMHFRRTLGQYPTGVVVITAVTDGEVVGMTVGSFASVSIDPPLVAFFATSTSGSWRAIRESGTAFCVNVLSADQEDVCRQVASRKSDKFEGIPLRITERGHAVLEEALAYIECETEAIHPGGDHDIVVGRVLNLDMQGTTNPLLFFRGGYGAFIPLSLASADAGLASQMRFVDVARGAMERLAGDLDAEVSAVCTAGEDLVIAATAGPLVRPEMITRVGQRWPFAPPTGALFAVHRDEAERRRWLTRAAEKFGAGAATELLERVEAEGAVYAVGPVDSQAPLFDVLSLDVPLDLVHEHAAAYNPSVDEVTGEIDLRFVSAPIVVGGEMVFELSAWGRRQPLTKAQARQIIDRVKACAAEISTIIIDAGLVPNAAAAV
ncbi:flavin reductase family protein [Microbacterium gorillae]|uniref:flavin reductase family protein n=1 Tax=Microbacterium gorillae TaxID=1231063 RepID=UPI00058FD729|nr:flavin reductase family protein [Microbacterium gorillae]